MILGSSCNQPRATSGVPTAPTAVAPAPEANSAPPADGVELTQPLCEGTNRDLLVASAAYDLVGLVLALALFALMKRRLLGTRAVRYLLALCVAGALAATLVALDPLRADLLARCLNSADFARYVWLSGSATTRAALLGLLPGAVLAWLGCAALDRAY